MTGARVVPVKQAPGAARPTRGVRAGADPDLAKESLLTGGHGKDQVGLRVRRGRHPRDDRVIGQEHVDVAGGDATTAGGDGLHRQDATQGRNQRNVAGPVERHRLLHVGPARIEPFDQHSAHARPGRGVIGAGALELGRQRGDGRIIDGPTLDGNIFERARPNDRVLATHPPESC